LERLSDIVELDLGDGQPFVISLEDVHFPCPLTDDHPMSDLLHNAAYAVAAQ
jgi:hypothetical protein